MKRLSLARPISAFLCSAVLVAGVLTPMTASAANMVKRPAGAPLASTKPARSAGALRLSGLVALALDDSIPGLASSLPLNVTDTVDDTFDTDDVFRVWVNAGNWVTVDLTGAAGTDFDLYLYGPNATSFADIPAGFSESSSSTEHIRYKVTTSGYYDIDVYAWTGSGAYTLSASMAPVEANDEVPGVSRVVPFTVNDALNALGDCDDVFAFNLQAGERLTLNLTGAGGSDFNMAVLPSTATTVEDWSTAIDVSNNAATSSEQIVFTARGTDVYYVDVYAYAGAGAYTLTASKSWGDADDHAPGILRDGNFTNTETIGGIVDIMDVSKVYLAAGTQLDLSLTPATPSTYVAMFVYQPGTTNVYDDTAVMDSAYALGAPATITFTAPVSGYYPISVYSKDGSPYSSYQLTGAVTCFITPSAGLGGVIAPSVEQTVALHGTSAFTLTPDPGFHVAKILVDGVSAGASTSFTFTDVAANHTIEAVFSDTYAITPTAGAGGSLSPAVVQDMVPGTDTTFTVIPAPGYHIVDVLVDGVSQGVITEYGFTNVTADHTIAATFASDVAPTSITIRTNATTSYIGKVPILSGAVTPFSMVGKNIVVWVKKPGKSYYSYSSNRTVYNLGGNAAWQYKYYFKPGMTKGIYYFKASCPAPGFGYTGFLTSTSGVIAIRLR